MEKFDVEFYQKENGEEPVKDFILGLEPKMQAKLLKIVDLLEENGTSIGMPYSSHLEDGIFEIRAKQGTNLTRVLYFSPY